MPLPEQRDIEDNVERAFDLLRHYWDALRDDRVHATEGEESRALAKIEDALRRWLPLAAAAREPVIVDVQKAIGRRDEAKRLLAATDLWQERQACLQRLAGEAYPREAAPQDLVDRCRAEITKWRSTIPLTRQGPAGLLAIDLHLQLLARATSSYWSVDLTSRPSRMGASFFLAAACDAVAHAAQRRGIPRDAVLPAIHLAVRLRRHPDWARIELREAPQVLEEQLELSRGVEDLLAELAVTREQQREQGQQRMQPNAGENGYDATQAQPHPPRCLVDKTGPDRALVQEGGTKVTIKGPRRVWLLLTVVNANRMLTWSELVEADIRIAADILDRRVKSLSASGTDMPKHSLGNRRRGEETPKMATEAKTLQNLGSRIRSSLGKLAYHWDQDGKGVVWSPDCQ